MRPLTIDDAHVIEIAIQQEILRSEEARYDHRLHGLLLVCKGYSCNKTAEILGQSPRSVAGWVRRFEDRGLAGLRDRERPGRPSALEPEHVERVAGDLRRGPHRRRQAGDACRRNIQRHQLRNLPGTAPDPSPSRSTHVLDCGQRLLSPFTVLPFLAPDTSAVDGAGLPATVQPRTQSD